MYIIWSSVPTPLPPGHGHGSAIVLSPSREACGKVDKRVKSEDLIRNIHIYIYTYTHIYIYMYIHIHIIYVYIHNIYIYIYIYIHLYIYIYMYTHYTHTHPCIFHAWLHICIQSTMYCDAHRGYLYTH